MATIDKTPRTTSVNNSWRRFSMKRDMTNGLYDVWDHATQEYVVCDAGRQKAERILLKARINAFKATL